MRIIISVVLFLLLSCSITQVSEKASVILFTPEEEAAILKGGSYRIEGRLPIRRPEPVYSCNAQGRVVVSIKVNKEGEVVEAIPGVKGSTTSDKCLLARSKEAALRTTWQRGGSETPSIQVGRVIYNFSLY